ncbi:MAG: hypothetical protein R3B60_01225 [Candidatus Paceibacterota bacterium]
MSNFHRLVQKIIMMTFALCFMFVSVYVPQPWNHGNNISQVEAGIDAKDSTQWINRGLLWSIDIFSGIMAGILQSINYKEFFLDPMAWFAMKMVIAEITNNIISWINSGFKGRPMFVQDIERYMLEISDRVYGEFIHEIGANSFVCQPFRANVQVAFAQAYREARVANIPVHSVRSCDLAMSAPGSPIANLDNFINGSFNDGGWDAWYRVATQSNTFTPYGSLLAVQDEGAVQILNAETSENNLLEFADGFISNKICSVIPSSLGVNKERCIVSTPGQVISEALNFQLTAGVESLIAADEFSEAIGSMLANIGQQALMGASGLLGLSSGTGYTDYSTYGGNPAVDQLIIDQDATKDGIVQNIVDEVLAALKREQEYQQLAQNYARVLSAIPEPAFQAEANRIQNDLLASPNGEIIKAITDIQTLINDVQNGTKTVAQAYQEFKRLDSLHIESEIQAQEDKWFGMFNTMYADSAAVVDKYKKTISLYKKALEDAGYLTQAAEAQTILDKFAELEKIASDYANNVSSGDMLAGPKAIDQYLLIRNSPEYTEPYLDGKINDWDNLVNIDTVFTN